MMRVLLRMGGVQACPHTLGVHVPKLGGDAQPAVLRRESAKRPRSSRGCLCSKPWIRFVLWGVFVRMGEVPETLCPGVETVCGAEPYAFEALFSGPCQARMLRTIPCAV